MASKAVREALNICGWVHNGNPFGPLEDDPALLYTIVAHATEAERAALLRQLLEARLWAMSLEYGVPGDVPMIGATNQVDELLDHLAPIRESGDAVHVTSVKDENGAPE